MNRFNLILGQAIPRAAAPKVSGTMEVIAPEDGFVLEARLPLSRHSSLGWSNAIKEPKIRQNGKLRVFGAKDAMVIEPIQTVPRMGCRNESSSRSYTPSKQILLNAPKSSLVNLPLEKSSLSFHEKTFAMLSRNALTKIVENDNSESSERLPDVIEEKTEIHNDEQLKTVLPKLNHETEITEAKTESEVTDEKEKKSMTIEKASSSEVGTETQGESIDKENAGDDKSSDSSDDDDSGQSNDVQKQIAPLELMGEFLKAIMEQKFSLAKKLCQMILIYEPENPEAKQFLPLIEHKLLLESQQPDNDEEDDDETDDESSDDSEEDTSSTDNDETESEASSKDSDDNED